MKKFRWIGILYSHIIAFSILAFILTVPLGFTGFLSGYVGWAIVLPLVINEMDGETKEALKKWATMRKGGDCNE